MGYAEEAFLSPDQLPGDTFADQATEVSEYAQEAMNRVAAQYRFAGLVAGIKGPNDTDDDVDAAREAVLTALADFLNPETGPLRQEIDRLHTQLRAEQDAIRQQMLDEGVDGYSFGLVDDIFPRGHPTDQAPGMMDYMGQGGRDAAFDDAMHRHGLGAALRQRMTAARDTANQIAALETQRRAQAAAEFRAFWSGIWSKAKDYYNDKMALVAEGKYLVAAGKIVVDGVEVFHVEIVVAIITAAVIAATGGVTVAMAPIIASAVAAAIRVFKTGAGVLRRSADKMAHGRAATLFRVEVRKVETSPLNTPVAQGDPIHSHDVDVARDLTDDEKRGLNEENQGSTEPTDDAGDPGSAAAAKRRQRDADYDEITAGLTPTQLRLAASAGASPAQIAARTKLRSAYQAKFGESNLNSGMDLDEPMKLVRYPPPDKIVTWQNELAYRPEADADGAAGSPYPFGNFFDPYPSRGATPNDLGINSVGRERIEIDVSDRPGLAFEGYGAEITDTWTVKGIDPDSTTGHRVTTGGVPQWHVANTYKPHPSDSDVATMNWRELPGNKHWVEAEEAGLLDYESYPGSNGRNSYYIYGDTPPDAEGAR